MCGTAALTTKLWEQKTWCAEQESNLHQAEFESAASADWAISACPPRESNPQLASGLSRWPLPLGYAGEHGCRHGNHQRAALLRAGRKWDTRTHRNFHRWRRPCSRMHASWARSAIFDARAWVQSRARSLSFTQCCQRPSGARLRTCLHAVESLAGPRPGHCAF